MSFDFWFKVFNKLIITTPYICINSYDLNWWDAVKGCWSYFLVHRFFNFAYPFKWTKWPVCKCYQQLNHRPLPEWGFEPGKFASNCDVLTIKPPSLNSLHQYCQALILIREEEDELFFGDFILIINSIFNM